MMMWASLGFFSAGESSVPVVSESSASDGEGDPSTAYLRLYPPISIRLPP